MTTLAHRVVRQHGFLVALASGLLVLAVSIVQSVLNAVIGQLSFLGSSGVPAWQWWAGYATQFASTAVPFSRIASNRLSKLNGTSPRCQA